ncbi:hypothetical protein [Lentzea sp. NPDC051838]|uniref:hypothetical protein n=1 Tax=Lentzea sp. NPDC051838 TaxID=3154849 RepID=UPI00341F3774
MLTTEEIQRRVKEADADRGAKRSATAARVGDLAKRRAAVAEQLADIDRELGDVIAESSDVIEIDELARFTDVPAADLNQWLNSRKATRPRRKRATAGTSTAKSDAPHDVATTETPSTGRLPTSTAHASSAADALQASARVPAEVA